MKKIFLLVLFGIIFSCGASKKDYSFIRDYVIHEIDGIDIENIYLNSKPKEYNETIIIYYPAYNDSKKRIKNPNKYITLFQNEYDWIFSEKEILYLRKEYGKQNPKLWAKNEIRKLGINNYYDKNNLIPKNKRSKSTLILLSRPLFNSRKTKCMFYFDKVKHTDYFSSNGHIVMFIKKNGKWIKVGRIDDPTLY